MGRALPISYLLDPKIAAYAVAPEPAWLWSADGTRVLWANAVGATVFGAATAAALTSRTFETSDRAAQQVARMAETLVHDGAARLERFTGFGSSLLRPLTCICSRVTLGEEPAAILICGVEPLRPPLPLIDRLQRLLVDTADAVAAFTTAGDLVFATASARAKLPAPNTFEALGASDLATRAIDEGASAGDVGAGHVKLWRVGRQGETLVMLRFEGTREAATDEPGRAAADTAAQQQSVPAKQSGQNPAINISKAVALAKEHGASAARRHPLRFVWQMDTEQRFTLVSDEFLGIASTATAQNNGAPWPDICAALAIDPLGSVADAIATRDTWSGIVLSWPTYAGDHLTVELAGLPIFDRQREFTGYRGFGVCRDTAHLARLAQHLRAAEAGTPRAKVSDEPVVMAEPAPVTPPSAGPMLSIVPASANVVPFPAASPAEARTPGLTAGDRKAFSDIAQQLAARLKSAAPKEDIAPAPPPLQTGDASGRIDGRADVVSGVDSDAMPAGRIDSDALFAPLPFGILIYRAQELLYANCSFLKRVGHRSLGAFAENGGLDNLLLAPGTDLRDDPSARRLTVETPDQGSIDVDAWLLPMPYEGEPAYALILDNPPRPGSNAAPARASIREQGHDRALDKILEQQLAEARRRADQTAAEHVAFLGSLSRDIRTPLTAIVGFAESILSERFGPIGNERYRDYLDGIRSAGSRILALIEHLGDARPAVPATTPQGETASPPTPDIAVDLNLIVQACVTELQTDAARERVLIRTSLTRPLPSVAADAKAVRQIVQNLMTNSIKLAGAGGQVIVSTGVSASGMISLRLRDTGMGLNENELAASMQPAEARSVAAGDGSEGRLKIAVAKALAEANRASLTISSRPNDGTLVEVSFSEMSAPAA
jgi:signal transduction histidine kinase